MEYTVKQLAKLAGVSVCTLHYYDEIGLLKPAHVKPNGYRCYGEDELVKLLQIMFFRELEFPLEQIIAAFESPGFDAVEALADQRLLLGVKRDRLDRVIANIDTALGAMKGEREMTIEEMYGAFSKEEMEAKKREVRARWGSKLLDQSDERTKDWSPADYRRVQAEGEEIARRVAALMDRGPADEAVQQEVGTYFRHICRFYDCTGEVFRGLGEMYVTDERFADYFRRFDPALPEFMRDAIAVWCERNP